ncbi:MAG: helix-turn-helix domain-containing protein [Acidobacteriota bacterium]
MLPIHLPPLRERREDIPELALYFISQWCEANGRRRPDLSPEALAVLTDHPWRGNVRELKNAVERLMILGQGEQPDPKAIRWVLSLSPPGEVEAAHAMEPDLFRMPTLREFREAAERRYLIGKLKAHNWNIAATARAIGTPRSNLYKKLEAYGIRRQEDGSS